MALEQVLSTLTVHNEKEAGQKKAATNKQRDVDIDEFVQTRTLQARIDNIGTDAECAMAKAAKPYEKKIAKLTGEKQPKVSKSPSLLSRVMPSSLKGKLAAGAITAAVLTPALLNDHFINATEDFKNGASLDEIEFRGSFLKSGGRTWNLGVSAIGKDELRLPIDIEDAPANQNGASSRGYNFHEVARSASTSFKGDGKVYLQIAAFNERANADRAAQNRRGFGKDDVCLSRNGKYVVVAAGKGFSNADGVEELKANLILDNQKIPSDAFPARNLDCNI